MSDRSSARGQLRGDHHDLHRGDRPQVLDRLAELGEARISYETRTTRPRTPEHIQDGSPSPNNEKSSFFVRSRERSRLTGSINSSKSACLAWRISSIRSSIVPRHR